VCITKVQQTTFLLPCTFFGSLRDRLDRLRIVKQLSRVILGLDLLQPPQVLAVVQPLRVFAAEGRIRVVDVHAPITRLERCRDGINPPVEELGSVGGVRAVVNTVVKLDDVKLVAMSIGRLGIGGGSNGGVPAAVHVELEPPTAVGDLSCVVPPVVDKVLGGRAGETLQGDRLGEEDFLLRNC
jgi:hypothetical protein